MKTLGMALLTLAVALPAFAGGRHSVPEISPGSAATVLTMLAGLALVRPRRRKA